MAAGSIGGCGTRLKRTLSATIPTVNGEDAYLKVHMRSGDVYVLRNWKVIGNGNAVTGFGSHLTPSRHKAADGTFTLPLADVALFETNVVENSPAIAALAVVTGISLAVTVACATNPKSCFGSCPTFYAAADDRSDGRPVLQAEGFSDSISPALEATDIDALWRTRGRGGPLVVRMTNEAYETHVVKQADVLAVPIESGQRVIAEGDRLWRTSDVRPFSQCRDEAGLDCSDELARVDDRERLSLTDATDLAARETLELTMAAPAPIGDERGIVVAARQSLVTTFLMYQGLAYLGRTAGGWLALMERGDQRAAGNGRRIREALGGIEVQIPTAGGDGWRTIGEIYETGPLATDVHLVRLPSGERAGRIRLRMPRGGWRIDHVGWVDIVGPASPIRLEPTIIGSEISKTFAPSRAPAQSFPIITQPGDAYQLQYQVPAGEHALLLESRGYYLEWMRKEWLDEEAPLRALHMLANPSQALRDLAPAFKAIEADAETMFWRSRYAHP